MSDPGKRFTGIGSAVASGIPVDAQGNFPVNRVLIAVLVFGFALFNQALCWLLAVLLHGRDQTVVADRFQWASLGLGGALWLLLVVVHVRVTGGGRKDLPVIMLTGVLTAAGWVAVSPGCVLGAVLMLTAWSARDFKKQAVS
jgi:hypothetical protein